MVSFWKSDASRPQKSIKLRDSVTRRQGWGLGFGKYMAGRLGRKGYLWGKGDRGPPFPNEEVALGGIEQAEKLRAMAPVEATLLRPHATKVNHDVPASTKA